MFLLYIATSVTTIAMVLVQDNLHGQEHVIYYASMVADQYKADPWEE